MIIKNNFNKKSVNPLDNYNGIGRGSHSLDKLLDDDRNGFIKENMTNPVMQDLRENHDDNDDNDSSDNWKLFR